MSLKHALVTSVSIFLACLMPLQVAQAWGRFEGGIHPAYDRHFHRDPVVVHREFVQGGHGCVGCGVGAAAVVGLVAGAAVGAAIVAANEQPRTVVVEQAPPPTTVVVQGPAYGTQVAMLPPGCAMMNINGGTFYRCDQYWYQPYMGGNGVYYTLIPPPM